jgi:hypothetical protein
MCPAAMPVAGIFTGVVAAAATLVAAFAAARRRHGRRGLLGRRLARTPAAT